MIFNVYFEQKKRTFNGNDLVGVIQENTAWMLHFVN